MILYDKYTGKTLEFKNVRQAELLLKYKPNRYVKASEVNEVDLTGQSTLVDKEATLVGSEPALVDKEPILVDKDSDVEIDATPGAIKAAEELGIDLVNIYDGKRITKTDVINAANNN